MGREKDMFVDENGIFNIRSDKYEALRKKLIAAVDKTLYDPTIPVRETLPLNDILSVEEIESVPPIRRETLPYFMLYGESRLDEEGKPVAPIYEPPKDVIDPEEWSAIKKAIVSKLKNEVIIR